MKAIIALTICMMFGVVGYGHVETNETHLHDLSQTNVTTRVWGLLNYTAEVERTVTYSNQFFVVNYVYNTMYFSRPAISWGQPHYDAIITVYEVIDAKRIQVCDTFDGIYTADGCFEGEPESHVKRALEYKKDNPEWQEVASITLGGDLVGHTNAVTHILDLDLCASVLSNASYRVAALTDEDIKEVVTSGRVCKVVGHTWGSSPALIYAPGWSFRRCRICKKEESRSLSDWK